jgi:raffinose/stachyose/melibiose transport system substrate-binding protein
MKKMWLKTLTMGISIGLIISVFSGCNSKNNSGESSDSSKKLTLLTDNQSSLDGLESTIAAFEEKTGIKTEIELRPGGSEGENTVKTRLATGDMTDLFLYNSGSLFTAIDPETNVLDLTDEAFMEEVMDEFKDSVTVNERVYGIPSAAANAGGWLYNKKVYEELNLSVPKTWDELIENCEKIKDSGDTVPVIGSYKDSWTAQIILLSDYYNLNAKKSDFADDYTNNKAKFAEDEYALRGFEKLQEVYEKDLLNEDYLSTTSDVGLKMIAEGTGAHYPTLTFMIENLAASYPDSMDDIGFFAQPGDDKGDYGLTIWISSGIYINKNSENIDLAKEWAEFYVSNEGINAYMEATTYIGPYMVNNIEAPEDVYPCVEEIVSYFDEGNTSPALEFLSPLKGPNLPQICVEAGSGIKTPLECAEEYDNDVKKQAKQLGLDGW